MKDDDSSRHLTARIREAIAEDPRTHTLDIQVLVSSGKVFLMGQVACEARRHAVLEVARENMPSSLDLVSELWIQSYAEPTETERVG